ncbi:DNA topoisomerase [Xylaria curta]|nr:DNA topoisomerase [Xylaria curta]
MCLTNHYISRNCGHHWLAIRQPCWPGYGFTYCGVFGDGVAREPSPEFEIIGLCPACATPGYYDRNLVRMVTNVRERCRWGMGPSRRDPGVECKGIPVEIHQKEKDYIPELVFGHLLAGSNFDDEEERIVGGRNGYGAKLCDVFSTQISKNQEIQNIKQFLGLKHKQTYNDTKSLRIKEVIELADYVSEQTSYHHGEANHHRPSPGFRRYNVNCLEPSGNFGSQLAGGPDVAGARYTYPRLSPFARHIFSTRDEPNLEHHIEDGQRIEPKVYAPVIPMILVNGAEGIGTGRHMRRLDEDDEKSLEEKPFIPMVCRFKGWNRTFEPAGANRYQRNGIAYQDATKPNTIIVTELPMRALTDDCKVRLEDIIRAEKTPSFIKDYKEYDDHRKVYFKIQLNEKHTKAVLKEGLLEKFKLVKQMATSNLVAFDTRGMIRKYEKVEDILEEFYHQARVIQEITDGKLVVSRKKKQVLVGELRQRKYEAFAKSVDANKSKDEDEEHEIGDDVNTSDINGDDNDYDYLLSMSIWSFTQEWLGRLKEQIAKKKAEHDEQERLSEKDMWCKDLDTFEAEWENRLHFDQEITTGIRKMSRTSKKICAGRGRKPKGDDDDEYGPIKGR